MAKGLHKIGFGESLSFLPFPLFPELKDGERLVGSDAKLGSWSKCFDTNSTRGVIRSRSAVQMYGKGVKAESERRRRKKKRVKDNFVSSASLAAPGKMEIVIPFLLGWLSSFSLSLSLSTCCLFSIDRWTKWPVSASHFQPVVKQRPKVKGYGKAESGTFTLL